MIVKKFSFIALSIVFFSVSALADSYPNVPQEIKSAKIYSEAPALDSSLFAKVYKCAYQGLELVRYDDEAAFGEQDKKEFFQYMWGKLKDDCGDRYSVKNAKLCYLTLFNLSEQDLTGLFNESGEEFVLTSSSWNAVTDPCYPVKTSSSAATRPFGMPKSMPAPTTGVYIGGGGTTGGIDY